MRVVVCGGFGDVGSGIVRRFLSSGNSVIAVARSTNGAERLRTGDASDRDHLDVLSTDLSQPGEVAALVDRIDVDSLDAVVMSVHAGAPEQRLLDWSTPELGELWQRSMAPHLNAARALIPSMRPDAVFLGIGGGTADYIIPGIAALSLVQSSQRMMYRAFAKEAAEHRGPHVRELIVRSMVNGHSSRAWARPEWLTDDEIGARVLKIVSDPEAHPGPILEISEADRAAP